MLRMGGDRMRLKDYGSCHIVLEYIALTSHLDVFTNTQKGQDSTLKRQSQCGFVLAIVYESNREKAFLAFYMNPLNQT